MVDPTGTFLGNMLGLDPQSAGQFQAARDQMGGIGMAQGALQNSGFHFPGGVTLAPGAAGLLGMMQAQAAVPQEALQAAQAGNQTAEAMYRRLQGQELLAKLPLYQQAVAEGSGIRPPGQPGQPALGQPGQQPQLGIGSGAVLPGGLPLHSVQNAIWKTESGGKVDGVSDGSSGEIGPMQIMPDTGKQFGASIDDLRDNNRNLQVGGSIIANYAQKYNGDPLAIAVAYNAGPGAADKWLAAGRDPSVLPKSTRDVYLPKFQENLSNFAQAAPAQSPPGAPSPVMAGNGAPMGSPAPAPSAAPPTMQTPPGMTQADVDAANTRIRRNQLLGIPVNPADQQIATYGLEVGKAGATTRQQKEIELGYTAPIAQAGAPWSRAFAPHMIEVWNPQTQQKEFQWASPPVPGLPDAGGSMPPQMPGAGAGSPSAVPGAQTPPTTPMAPTGPQTVPMLPSQPVPGSSMVPGGAQGLMPRSFAIANPGPAATKEQEGRGTDLAQYYKDTNAAAESAKTQQANLMVMRSDADNIPFTGPLGDATNTFNQWMRLVDPSYTESVKSAESFVKNGGALLRGAVKDTSSKAAVQEFNLISKTMPSLDTSPAGLKQLLGEFQGFNDYKIAKSRAMNNWIGDPSHANSVAGFEAQWQNSIDPYTFLVMRMDPASKQAFFSKLSQQKGGDGAIKALTNQIQYIKQNGLEPNF